MQRDGFVLCAPVGEGWDFRCREESVLDCVANGHVSAAFGQTRIMPRRSKIIALAVTNEKVAYVRNDVLKPLIKLVLLKVLVPVVRRFLCRSNVKLILCLQEH